MINHLVVLVEDDPATGEMLNFFFSEKGFRLHVSPSGEQALVDVLALMPHVILLDIELPGMDGFAAAAAFRQNSRIAHIPFIFLTKRGTREARLSGLELGADDFIPKPFDMQEVLLRIQNSITRAETERRIHPRTGLPSAHTTRAALDDIRSNPHAALIEITLQGIVVLGTAARHAVHDLCANVLVDTTSDFIAFHDETRFVAACQRDLAEDLAEHIRALFAQHLKASYPDISGVSVLCKVNQPAETS